MKLNGKTKQIVAVLLMCALFMLVFSSLLFLEHDCHGGDCSICSFKESQKLYFLPILLSIVIFLADGLFKLFSLFLKSDLKDTSLVKLKVKLSN